LGNPVVIAALADALNTAANALNDATAAGAGGLIAVTSSLINILIAALIARPVIDATHSWQQIINGRLSGVDLSQNPSITGSLATILTLGTIRRAGENVALGRYHKVRIVVTAPALLMTLRMRQILRANTGDAQSFFKARADSH
jgi:Na+/H+ antiporter NhaD/arsenite permease-like protein